MTVMRTDTLGMVRVRFKAGQRDAAIDELREHREVYIEAQQTYRRRGDQDGPEVALAAQKMEIVERALAQAEGSEPGRPLEIVAPIWLVQSQIFGATGIALEHLTGTVEALRRGYMPDGAAVPDGRAAVRQAAKDARAWLKLLLGAYEFPRQPHS